MKLNKWLYGAAALAMFAACSDKDIAPDSGGSAEKEDNGYISINIQLPTAPSTRAEFDPDKTGNDNFDDGEKSEYAINDAVLVLFQGASQDAATFIGAFNLQHNAASEDKDEDNDQVTKHLTRVAKVSGIDENKLLYALVMVNGDSKNIYDIDNLDTSSSWMNGKTISEIQETKIDNALFTQRTPGVNYASDIFMTNSPLSKTRGGNYDPEVIEKALPVLVQLNPKTYDTPQEALEHPASTINVERAVGKITCSKFSKTTGEITDGVKGDPLTLKYVVGDNTYEYKLEVASVSWGLAQDMKETFVVRNTNRTKGSSDKLWKWSYANAKATATSGKYRMLGGIPLSAKNMNDDFEDWYRPYFCRVPGYGEKLNIGTAESPSYDTHKEAKQFNKTSFDVNDGSMVALQSKDDDFASSGAFYPRENTFPVEFMKYANTTRIGFWVNFSFVPQNGAPAIGNGVNFYIKGADKTTIYLDNDKKDPLTFAAIESLKDFETHPDIKTALNNALGGKDVGSLSGFDLGNVLVFAYDIPEKQKSGLIKITGVEFSTDMNDYPDSFKSIPQYDFSSVIDNLNDFGQYYEYTGGKVFYEVRIKHFGDDLTPWNIGTDNASTIDESYGNVTKGEVTKDERDNDFLGRYGIVRNNWYDLEVNTIAKLGDPRDPALWDTQWSGKPDDNKDQYIAVILHVLSWAKRSQQVEF